MVTAYLCDLTVFLHCKIFLWKMQESFAKHSEQSYTHCVRHLGASCAGLEERLRTHRHKQVTVNDAVTV